jgi:hypothetical protein
MLALLKTFPQGRGSATDDTVERIAQETAELPNRLAWPEILAILRATGHSAARAPQLRGEVWAARRRNTCAACL